MVYDIKAFEDKYGLKVDQFVDFKALKGDPSDNIPGVKGIGEKTAMEILNKYQSLDNLYKNIDNYLADSKTSAKDKKLLTILKENEDEAMFSRHLSLIKKDVDVKVAINDVKFDFNNKEKVLSFLKIKGFNSLVAKLNVYDRENNLKDKKVNRKITKINEIRS
ncbi:MAG: 5'-3' exonuclease H3TH domain-containing protein [Candidatus Paceibacterota bacterium]